MSDYEATAVEEIEADPYVVDKEDFEREGLMDTGPYNWRFESMQAGHKNVFVNNEPTDEKYPVIFGVLEAFERAVYDEDGTFDGTEEIDPPLIRRETFKLTGTGAKKLRTAYRAVTGRALSGQEVQVEDPKTGKTLTRYRVDLLAAAEELLDGTAWNNVFHTDSTEKFPARDLITNTFKTKPPQRIRVAKDEDEE